MFFLVIDFKSQPGLEKTNDLLLARLSVDLSGVCGRIAIHFHDGEYADTADEQGDAAESSDREGHDIQHGTEHIQRYDGKWSRRRGDEFDSRHSSEYELRK